ncbi:MAG: hypothetical protein ABWX74_16830, partial [Aeromicrobium sp.]
MSKVLQRVFLVAFVIVDIVLVGAAIRHVNGTPPSADMPDAAASAAPTATPSAGSSSAAPSAQVPYDFTASEAASVAAANDGTIVVGTRGTCAGGEATVMVSTNGGADFSESTTGLSTTLAVRATGTKAITVVGTDTKCEPHQLTSTDGGVTWTEDDEIDLWYPDSQDTTLVVSPRRSSQPAADCVVMS